MYSPSMDKLDTLASVLELHPVTLVASSYLNAEPEMGVDVLLERLKEELMVLHGPGK